MKDIKEVVCTNYLQRTLEFTKEQKNLLERFSIKLYPKNIVKIGSKHMKSRSKEYPIINFCHRLLGNYYYCKIYTT